MKKTIIIPIIALLAIIMYACSSSTSSSSMYPATVGAWTVQSADNADWSGLSSSSKVTTSAADTILITQPGQQGLSIEYFKKTNGADEMFFLIFTDSTITKADDISITPHFAIENTGRNGFDLPGAYSISANNYRLRAQVTMAYNCDYSVASDTKYVDVYFNKASNDSLFKAYRIRVDGMDDVVNHIVCGDPLSP